MKILVTGGAGYIGKFMVKRLTSENTEVVVVDKLGKEDFVDSQVTFIAGDLLDKKFVTSLFESHEFDAVVHFAGYISMEESMQNPGIYLENNVQSVINVLEGLKKKKRKNFIFSSTAGVYGNPINVPIPEDHPKNPTNPYGESKFMAERVLAWYYKICEVNYIALRYFNASGAALDGSMGENHSPETHLIPNVINSVLQNKPFTLYGEDYQTPDGTCVRDYIHVLDLIEAHMLALKKLNNSSGEYTFNVGTGRGYSNKEVIEMVEKVSGQSVMIEVKPKRSGDAEMLVADASRINHELGFSPQFSDLETIIKSAWEWHRSRS